MRTIQSVVPPRPERTGTKSRNQIGSTRRKASAVDEEVEPRLTMKKYILGRIMVKEVDDDEQKKRQWKKYKKNYLQVLIGLTLVEQVKNNEENTNEAKAD